MQQKDEKVQSLLADIESTQELHKRNFESHLQVLDFAISKWYECIVIVANFFLSLKDESLVIDVCQKLSLKPHTSGDKFMNP